MPKKKMDPLLLEQLDRRIEKARRDSLPYPPHGWVRSIREALGMSLQQLASRLNITPQSLTEMEQAEAEGRITLVSLRRLAEALGAEVQLAVIPQKPLAEMLRGQARKVATKIVMQTQTHMALEDQANSPDFLKKQIEELTDELVRKGNRRIWDET